MRDLTIDELEHVCGGYLTGSTPVPEVIVVWGKRIRTSDRGDGGGGGGGRRGMPDQSERSSNDDTMGPLDWWNSMSEGQRNKIIGGLMGIGAGLAIVALTLSGPVAIGAAITAVIAGTATTAQVTAVAMTALGVIAAAGGSLSLIGDL